jgi:hypothetical protein
MFASMIGHELVAQYHLQNQLRLGLEGMAAAAQLGIPPNGFLPGFLPPPLLPPQPTSNPSTPLLNGHAPINIVPGHESPLERIHNIAKSELINAQVLDTADVAQKIRELLSSHNIGQRLFAKHVLGLSQGTVSELLSKPKHWDKLTEKGRESYRKMALWANDDNNVLALKAIAPKKGNYSVVNLNDLTLSLILGHLFPSKELFANIFLGKFVKKFTRFCSAEISFYFRNCRNFILSISKKVLKI